MIEPVGLGRGLGIVRMPVTVGAPGGQLRQPGGEIVTIEALEGIRQVEKHERVEGPRFTVAYTAEQLVEGQALSLFGRTGHPM